MLSSMHNGYAGEAEAYAEQLFSETPFVDPGIHEQEDPLRESYPSETSSGNWEFTTPFLPGESSEAGESESTAPEVAEFSEIIGELKDTLFREALEQLADEAVETHSEQLAGEYGDREARDQEAERLLNDHFAPLAAEAEAMLDRLFQRLEGYEAESLTDTEIERISNEVLPTAPMSPASEQFLGGLLRKAGKLVSGAVNLAKKGVAGAVKLAGKGLAAVGKLALGPLLKPLKLLGKFLLKHVVKFALNQLPPALRPLGQKLSDQPVQGDWARNPESETNEQTESQVLPAAENAARLEAEFDVHVAQLLLTPDETEIDHLVSSYGEGESESYSSPLTALDDTRTQLIKELSRLEPGESATPVMEQFVPALLWPAAKTAITIIGRPKLVKFLGNLLSGLIKPLIGAEPGEVTGPLHRRRWASHFRP